MIELKPLIKVKRTNQNQPKKVKEIWNDVGDMIYLGQDANYYLHLINIIWHVQETGIGPNLS